MPKRSRKPHDVNRLAASIVAEATGEEPEHMAFHAQIATEAVPPQRTLPPWRLGAWVVRRVGKPEPRN